MATGMYFHPTGMTAKAYDEVMERLAAAGAASPKGRLYHFSFGADDDLMVFDVWSSQADFDAFGAVLMPVLQQLGIDPGQPDVMPIHNVVEGPR